MASNFAIHYFQFRHPVKQFIKKNPGVNDTVRGFIKESTREIFKWLQVSSLSAHSLLSMKLK